MKIVVFGWYGHDNLGDESYRTTIPQNLGPKHEYRFLDYIQKKDVEWCDVVVVGGGNVLKPGFTEQLVGITKPIYGLSVGIETEKLAHPIPFKHIWAREDESVDILKKSGISTSLMPDLALTLKGDPIAGKEWIKQQFKRNNLDLYEKVGVVVVNNYLIHGHIDGLARNAFTFLDFSYKLARVLDETSASFVFLPFGTKPEVDDRITNGWVASKCKWWKKNHLSFERLSVQETMNVIAASDVMVSTRLHSSVFSYACGVPFVDITHHSKNQNFLKTIGRSDFSVSFWDFESRLAHEKLAMCLKNGIDNDADKYRMLIQKEVNAIPFS